MMKIKTEVIDPEDLYSMSTDRNLTDESDYNYSMLLGHPSDPHTLSTPGPYMGMYTMKQLPNTRNVSRTVTEPEHGMDDNQSWSANKEIKTSVSGTGKQKSKPKYRVRDYVCKYCGKIYHHTTRLKNHVKQYHSKQMKNETLGSAAQESNADSTQTQTGETEGGGITCGRSHNSKCQHCNKTHRNLDKNLAQHDMEVKCYQELMSSGSQQKTDLRLTEVLTEENNYYLTNEDLEDVEQSGSIKATKIPPINQARSGRRTRSSTKLMQEAPNAQTQESTKPRDQLLDNDIQQDHIRLEVLSYQKDEEMCRRQVMLSGMLLGDRHSPTDQLDDATLKKKTLKSGNENQVSPSAPDTSGNATDGANIQFWCKCGKSFTSLSTFVVHKFPCEAAANSDKM
ncbi:hypothetical protein KP79_PYT13010 [Mizuhopecten yessoensis]|uniref:C2H2-type domain-containing protein n=2 Tax=Mizuhopecten yessoensis TaxID=6573 RepID=A0A210QC14_MIZYE|nr:hypothetical protein KP79_PYT13010 [Mizuhopecten yessoensis]